MTILAFTGIPGSGKSAHAARVIRESLDRRYPRPVIANFPLGDSAAVPDDNRRYYHYVPNEEMSVDAVLSVVEQWWNSGERTFDEDVVTLIFDEAQILFNARKWADAKRMAYLEFLTQSRKYGLRVILITQNLMMIDNQFRMLVDTEYNHRRVSTLGIAGKVLALPFGNRLSMCVRYLVQGRERLGASVMLFNQRDFSMYDSYTKFRRTE